MDFPKQVTHVPVDFNKESLKNVLENAGYETEEVENG